MGKKLSAACIFLGLLLISCEEKDDAPIDLDRMVNTEEEQEEGWVVEKFDEEAGENKPAPQERVANDEDIEQLR